MGRQNRPVEAFRNICNRILAGDTKTAQENLEKLPQAFKEIKQNYPLDQAREILDAVTHNKSNGKEFAQIAFDAVKNGETVELAAFIAKDQKSL